MRSSINRSHYSVLIGFLAAAIGFSYALATSSTSDDLGAEARAVGSNPRQPLTFTDPFVNGSSDRDLGDCTLGTVITRYVHARGGFNPHRFTSDRTTLNDADNTPLFIGATTLGEAEIALPPSANPGSSTTAVFLNGLVKGQVGNANGTIPDGTALRFDVTVVDSKGKAPTKHNETFRLTLFNADPNGAPRFAQSTLNSGVQFNKFFDKLEVLNGNAPYKFTASSIVVTPAGGQPATYTTLDEIGLFLVAKTGVVTGRPLVSGTVSFVADCVDSKGVHALSRDKSTVGQLVTFNVDPSTRITSDLFSTKLSIKGDEANAGKDTIEYSGLLNLAGSTVSQLDGLTLTLTIGNYTITSTPLSNGKATSTTTPGIAVSIGSDGTIKVTVKGESFGTALSIVDKGDLASNNKVLAVSVVIGDPSNATNKPAYQSSELLKFTLKVRKSTQFDLEYKFGPGNLGGGFIVTGVAGKDDKAETGDAWLVKFISLPPNGKKLSDFGSITQATVGIGTDFTNSITVAVVNGSAKSTEKRDKSQAEVLKVNYTANSGKGSAVTGLLPQTSALPNTQTTISPAFQANGKRSAFPFIITFGDTNGKELIGWEGSKKIIPKGNQWISRDLNR